LLNAALAPDEGKMFRSSRTRIILSRLAVVVGVLLLVGVFIVIRLFVHIDIKTDWTLLCIPTNSNATDPSSVNYTPLYPNVTLAPCNETTTVHLAATTDRL